MKPAWPSRLEASAIVLSTTLGTGRSAGPLDTKIVTSDPRGASSFGARFLVDHLADGRFLVDDLLLLHREALAGEQQPRLLHL